MFKLYYAPGTCALATHIALEEAGAPYEAVRLDFGSQAQRSPEYLAVNPKGRVPALVTESGTITETPGLLLFVAQRFPNAELAPLSDPFALAQVQEFNNYLCSTVHVAHAHGRRGARWVDDAAAIEAMQRKVPGTMTDCFALIADDSVGAPLPLVAALSAVPVPPPAVTLVERPPRQGIEFLLQPARANAQR
jgi:glutathione S-transferase